MARKATPILTRGSGITIPQTEHAGDNPLLNLVPSAPILGELTEVFVHCAAILVAAGDAPPMPGTRAHNRHAEHSKEWFAWELAALFHQINAAISQVDAAGAATAGFRAGALLEAFRLKHHWEDDVALAAKVRHVDDSQVEMRQRAIAEWTAKKAADPKLNDTRVDEVIGAKFGVSWRTIYGWRNPRKGKKRA